MVSRISLVSLARNSFIPRRSILRAPLSEEALRRSMSQPLAWVVFCGLEVEVVPFRVL